MVTGLRGNGFLRSSSPVLPLAACLISTRYLLIVHSFLFFRSHSLLQDICWVPIDVAADAVLEMRNSPTRVLHISHPAPVPWTSVFEAASERLDVPLVDFSEWMEVLEGSRGEEDDDVDIESNPALKLLEFFSGANEGKGYTSDADDTREAMGVKKLSLKESEKVSRTLHGCRASPMSGEDVKSWLSSWEKAGFIEIYA
jgi:hypothetical protein